jgi:hypothetical protein
MVISKAATFEDYLALQVPEDEVREEPVDPYSMDTSPGKPIKQVIPTRFPHMVHPTIPTGVSLMGN